MVQPTSPAAVASWLMALAGVATGVGAPGAVSAQGPPARAAEVYAVRYGTLRGFPTAAGSRRAYNARRNFRR